MNDWHEVFIETKGADKVMNMVRYLRQSGLVQGIDFNFKYRPGSYDWAEHTISPAGVSFTLKEGKWATFIRMKFDGKDEPI